jgi:hypothetical protein
MIDPGAIGTLIIGLGDERRGPEGGYRPEGHLPRQSPRRVVRPAIAIVLRHLADVLEPRQSGRAGRLDRESPVSDVG